MKNLVKALFLVFVVYSAVVGVISDSQGAYDVLEKHGIIAASLAWYEPSWALAKRYPEGAIGTVILSVAIWWLIASEPRRREQIRLNKQRDDLSKQNGQPHRRSRRKKRR